MSKLLDCLTARIEANRARDLAKRRRDPRAKEREAKERRKEAELQALLKEAAWTEFFVNYTLEKERLAKFGIVKANNVIPRIVAIRR